ncbi:unnamed protein product, partial [Prorocentrum cordatum]
AEGPWRGGWTGSLRQLPLGLCPAAAVAATRLGRRRRPSGSRGWARRRAAAARRAEVIVGAPASGPLVARRAGPLAAGLGSEGPPELPPEGVHVGGAPNTQLLLWLRRQLHAEAAVSFELLPDLLPGTDFSACSRAHLEYLLQLIQEGYVDFVALSMKNVPEALPEGLLLAAVLPRQDPREALLARPGAAAHAVVPLQAPEAVTASAVAGLDKLPEGAVVCAPCLRRRLQIESRYPHLIVDDQRTGFQHRLRLLSEGRRDACVCAAAELSRWGLRQAAGDMRVLEPEVFMPAFGQGAVGLLCRAQDEGVANILRRQDDPNTRLCVQYERALASRLSVPPGASAGGLAELLPDGKIRLRCALMQPGKDDAGPTFTQAGGEAGGEAGPAGVEALVERIVEELSPEVVPAPVPEAARSPVPRAAPAEWDDADELGQEDVDVDDDYGNALRWRESDSAVPPVSGASARIPVAEVDDSGRTCSEGRVCAVFLQGYGALVDVNCEAPARWYPEQSLDGSDEPAPELGSTVAVYCCRKELGKEQPHLQVALQPLPQLPRRGNVQRMRLSDLRAGKGPFRAVVVSCTAQGGALVDFNCEVPGRLITTEVLQPRGTELRVYCHEVDEASGTCLVADRPWKPTETCARMQLEELSGGPAEGYLGTVKNSTTHGYFVDFNCEVNGLLDPMDIDIVLCPDGLSVGREVRVYISRLDLDRRQVRLTMFRSAAMDDLAAVRVELQRERELAAKARTHQERALAQMQQEHADELTRLGAEHAEELERLAAVRSDAAARAEADLEATRRALHAEREGAERQLAEAGDAWRLRLVEAEGDLAA